MKAICETKPTSRLLSMGKDLAEGPKPEKEPNGRPRKTNPDRAELLSRWSKTGLWTGGLEYANRSNPPLELFAFLIGH